MVGNKTVARGRLASLGVIAGAAALLFAVSGAQAQTAKPYFEFKKAPMVRIDGDISLDTNGAAAPYVGSGTYSLGFEGVSQYDGASFARNFIPPDTMGAVGMTQYVETSNGAYAVFNKSTGARLSLVSDVAFWAAAGQTGANGDTRIMYNAAAQRWIAVAFGASTADLQIAVSDSDNALGTWKSTKFTGYAGGVADYPTLALDTNAVYIGTNNFTSSWKGTTLNVIPLNSLFSAGAPSVTGMQQFTTPYVSGSPTNVDRGFAQQGVNSRTVGSSGTVLATSAFIYDNVGFKVNGLTPTSAAAATLGANTYVGSAAFQTAGAGRQPSVALPANQRVIATLDERMSSSVYEANGRIYAVQTVDDLSDGLDEARVRYMVLDADTFAILDEGNIGSAGYDYYQGSIAVNSFGQVVIGYNRSGLDAATGKISFMAQTFNTSAAGDLVSTSGEILLKESLTDDYHNGSLIGQASVGRQRWGDYSQVSVDPANEQAFYLIGEFAREYNTPANGHPGGSGGSRWGTWVAVVNVTAVPEPATWGMMMLGFGVVGMVARRRRSAAA